MRIAKVSMQSRKIFKLLSGIIPVVPFFMVAYVWAAGNTHTAQHVQNDVRNSLNALYKGDVDTVLNFTHPAIVELSGGREVTRAQLSSVVATVKASGMELMSLTFPAPPQFLSGGGNEFVVVPTLSVMGSAITGDKVESLNFQVGMFDPVSNSWKYLEGSRLTDQSKAWLLPGFPADFKLPQTYMKKL